MSSKIVTVGQAIDTILSVLKELPEEERIAAMNTASLLLGINRQELSSRALGSQKAHSEQSDRSDKPNVQNFARNDIRALREQKEISSAKDMACLVAYYLKEVAPQDERKETVTAIDMETYFKQAGYKLPTRLTQLLIDAKQLGVFDSVGRGEYKLNAVGYNRIVHDLPSRKLK